MREVAGGYVRRILVGPLYANNFQIASSILYKLLKKFYVRSTLHSSNSLSNIYFYI